jgi:hypothetical protein
VPRTLFVLPQKLEAISKLDQVLLTGIGERDPSAGPSTFGSARLEWRGRGVGLGARRVALVARAKRRLPVKQADLG